MDGTLAPRFPLFLAIAALALGSLAADAAHARTWTLDPDGLAWRNGEGGVPRRVPIPGWMHLAAPHACAPDLAIAPDGAIVLSSNVVPMLWRVDPATDRAVAVPLALAHDEGREVGFTALRFVAPGVLEARGTFDASRWRIDLHQGVATRLSVGQATACQEHAAPPR